MRKLKICLSYFFLWLVFTPLQAYSYLPTVKCFNKIDYQAGRQNWDVGFDSNGIVYFGNTNGLLRYVYGTWQLSQTTNKDMIRSLCVENDTIWTGGAQEYGYFVKNTSENLSYKQAGKLAGGQIWKIQALKEKIYFQTEGAIIVYDKENRVSKNIYSNSGFFGIQIWNGKLWAMTRDGSIGVIENMAFKAKDQLTQLKGTEVRQLFVFNEKLSVLLFDGRLYSYNEKTLVQENMPAEIKGNALFSATAYQNEEWLVGSISNGLFHVNGKNNQMLTRVNTDNGLIDNTVLAIGKDDNGNVWLGLDYGIAYIEMKNAIQPIFDQGATYFVQSMGDTTFLATNKGLYFSQGSGAFSMIKGSDGQVWRLRSVDNELLVCHNKGLYKVNGEKFISLFPNEGIMDVVKFPGTNIYLLSAYSGLLLAKYENGQFNISENLQIWGNPKVLYDEKNKCVWADSKWGSVYHISLDDHLKIVIKNFANIVTYFNGDKQFVFYDGNQFSDYKESGFTPIKKAPFNSIEGENIVALDFDDNLNFVAYIQDGEPDMLANLHDGNFYSYKKILSSLKNNFVLNDEFIDIHEGELRVATDRGVSTFNVESHSSYSSGFNAVISKVQVLQEDTQVKEFIFPYVSDKILLPAGDKNILFHFGVLKSTSDFVEFRYRLWPYDKGWSEWNSLVNVKEYTRLNGGAYTFTLQTRFNGGLEKEQSFKFSIDKYWYQTSWVILPYVLLFVLCILFTIQIMRKVNRRSLKNQKERYKQKEALQSVTMKNEQLLKYTEVISRKNEFLIELKEGLARMRNVEAKQWENKILEEVNSEKKNFFFHKLFSELHQDFINRLTERYPGLTSNDIRMLSFIRINLDTREIASMMNISPKSVDISRYRIRKKMELTHDTDLNQFIRDL